MIGEILPGIGHSTRFRDRLAHNLEATVTEYDARVFLRGMFKTLRDASAADSETPPSENPIDVLEDYAQYASSALHLPMNSINEALMQAKREGSAQSDWHPA
jgi:hypothetical protein